MKNNINLLNYFLSRCLFLGGGFSLMFISAGTDSYISVILGLLLGIGIIYILSKLTSIKMPINEYLKEHKILNYIIKIVYFSYLLFFILIELLILSNFLYSYFLPFTPSFVSALPFIFIACFLNSKKSKNIAYVGLVLMIISISLVILKTTLITPEFDFSNLFPIFQSSPKNIFKATLIYAILSTSPYLLMIGEEIDFKSSLKYYLIAGVINIIVLTSITLTMGQMINIYSYPEYGLLRKIRFFNFIENVENIISSSWFYDIFIALSLSSIRLRNILNIQKRIIPLIIIFIISIIINYKFSDNFYNTMIMFKIFPYIFGILVLALVLLLFLKKITKKQHFK